MKQAVTSNLSGNEKIQYLKQTQWKNFPYPLPSENFEDLSPAQQNDVEIAYEQHVAANPPSTTTDGDSTNPAETNPNGTESQTSESGDAGTAGGATTGSDSGPTTDGETGVAVEPNGTSESASGPDAGTHENHPTEEVGTTEPTPVTDTPVENSVEQVENQPEEGSVNA